jgi:hypothetical protein
MKPMVSENPFLKAVTEAANSYSTSLLQSLNSPSSRWNKFDSYICNWSDENIEQIVKATREWNTNSKNSYLCTLLIDSLLHTHGYEKLLNIPTVTECLPALVCYSERHFQRISKLHESAYLSEYIISLMTNFPTQIPSESSTLGGKMSKTNLLNDLSLVKTDHKRELNSIRDIFGPVPDDAGDDIKTDKSAKNQSKLSNEMMSKKKKQKLKFQ